MAIFFPLRTTAACTNGKTDTAPPFQTPVESFSGLTAVITGH